MALNEFERRYLEVTQNHLDLLEAVKTVGGGQPPEYFGYTLTIGSAANPLLNGVSQQGVIAIQADAWFVLEYIQTAVILPAGSTFGDLSQLADSGNILLNITDTGSGHEWFSIPSGAVGVPATNVSGTPMAAAAGIPYVFPTPRLIPPQTNITVVVTQLGLTALTNPEPVGFYIMLNGARVPLGGN